MFYCEGKYCSRRAECVHNKPDISGRLQQWLDMSTQGSGQCWNDDNGKPHFHHEYWCGDRAKGYEHFVPICKED